MRARTMPRPLLALLLACPTGAALAQSIDELYDQAKSEGTLQFYRAGPSGAEDRWIEEFQRRFPSIKVVLTGGLSPALSKRIEQQLAAGKLEADLAVLQTIQDFGRWKQRGALLSFRPEGSEQIDGAYKDEDGTFTAVSVNLSQYAYNTKLVPHAEV